MRNGAYDAHSGYNPPPRRYDSGTSGGSLQDEHLAECRRIKDRVERDGEVRGFAGLFAFLSNFFETIIFTPKGLRVATVEHLFQAAKTKDVLDQKDILCSPGPTTARRKGRKVKLRSNWEQVKVKWMKEFLLWKFRSSTILSDYLMATGTVLLVEDNGWHDNFWGDCHCDKCKDIPGRNVLGILLMEVRTELQDEWNAMHTCECGADTSRLGFCPLCETGE